MIVARSVRFGRGSLVVRHWTFWEWGAYAALFVAASIVAAETGFKTEPEVMSHLPDFFRSTIWGFAPVLLVVFATIVLLLREFVFSSRAPRPNAQLVSDVFSNEKRTVSDKHFVNERVVIDRKSFINCEFRNVTLVYNGTGPFDFINSHFYGIFLSSDSPGIQGMTKLMYELKFLRIPLFVDGKPAAPPSTQGDPFSPPPTPQAR